MPETLEKVQILNVNFNKITLTEATKVAINFAKGEKQKYIVTPNPEILLEGLNNKNFVEILNQADLSIADGTGILWASKYLAITAKNHNKTIKILKYLYSLLIAPFYPKYIKKILPQRVTGTDLMEEICKKAPANNLKIFLLGAAEGTAEKTKEILEHKYPGIKIVGTFAGTPKEEDEKEIIEKINNSKAEVLFVAYGAPKQELWIHRNLPKIPQIKLAMGIGGAFNFIAKIRKRAPKLMQQIGLEWLYRLLQEPSRIHRIYNATIKFSRAILKSNLSK